MEKVNEDYLAKLGWKKITKANERKMLSWVDLIAYGNDYYPDIVVYERPQGYELCEKLHPEPLNAESIVTQSAFENELITTLAKYKKN